MSWTLTAVIAGLVLVVLDLFIPSGGLLSGLGIALLIERGLDALGVVGSIRWPMAGLGMILTVAAAIRWGERLTDRLFPSKLLTNLDRLIGMEGVVRQAEGRLVVELEGDLWSAVLTEDSAPLAVGTVVQVVAFEDQIPMVRPK